jgi:hypothetical protein
VLAQPRGRPTGLDFYSVAANRVRVSQLLDEIAGRGAGSIAQ